MRNKDGTFKARPFPVDKKTLHSLHWEENLPVKAIAERLGVSRDTIYRYMKKWDIPWRSIREDNKRRYKTMSLAERKLQTKSANIARRGSTASPEELRNNAKARENNFKLMSKWERVFFNALPPSLQHVTVYNYAIDKFNVDFAIPALKLAIEIHGGNWHDSPRKREQDLAKRAHLQEQGWLLKEIWSRDMDNVVSLLQKLSFNPAPIR